MKPKDQKFRYAKLSFTGWFLQIVCAARHTMKMCFIFTDCELLHISTVGDYCERFRQNLRNFLPSGSSLHSLPDVKMCHHGRGWTLLAGLEGVCPRWTTAGVRFVGQNRVPHSACTLCMSGMGLTGTADRRLPSGHFDWALRLGAPPAWSTA